MPSNLAFQRIHTGVLDPIVIGDKFKVLITIIITITIIIIIIIIIMIIIMIIIIPWND